MERQPLVTIVLPAFNAEKTVGDAIASILLQTYQNWELLVIDDGSSDQTVSVAGKFGDPRIKIFSDGVNKGLPARLNEGIDKSSGKYFARMDNDDICFPDRLEKQIDFLENHANIDLLGTRAITFVTPGKATGLFPFRETHEEICGKPWKGFYLPHPTWMGRLEWFKKNRYGTNEVMWAEDQELLLRTYPTSRFACLPQILFAYRVRSAMALGRNLKARKSLLRSQLRVFGARAQWGSVVLALLAFAAKSVSDLKAWLLGTKKERIGPELASLLPQWEELKTRLVNLQK